PLVMLDASNRRRVGGTGQRIPWESARVVAATRDVLLAGGLDAECVGDALDQVRPFGVDASSGLEREPGVKDPDKVRRFVAAVRAFDAALWVGAGRPRPLRSLWRTFRPRDADPRPRRADRRVRARPGRRNLPPRARPDAARLRRTADAADRGAPLLG